MDNGRARVRNMRSKCRCSYVLQFTFRRAVCCVLHRPPSQVIHCAVLSLFDSLAFAETAKSRPTKELRRENLPPPSLVGEEGQRLQSFFFPSRGGSNFCKKETRGPKLERKGEGALSGVRTQPIRTGNPSPGQARETFTVSVTPPRSRVRGQTTDRSPTREPSARPQPTRVGKDKALEPSRSRHFHAQVRERNSLMILLQVHLQ